MEAEEATVQSPSPEKDTSQPESPKVIQPSPPAENAGTEVVAEEHTSQSEIKRLLVDVVRKKRTLKILNRSLRMKKVSQHIREVKWRSIRK